MLVSPTIGVRSLCTEVSFIITLHAFTAHAHFESNLRYAPSAPG